MHSISLGEAWSRAGYLLYFLLLMFVHGLLFNYPCMLVYERYHGWPCFGLLKRCFIKR